MPFFICLNLLISFTVQTHMQLEPLLKSPPTEYLGIALVLLSIICMLRQSLTLALRYDLFCSGAVLIWISTWPPFFNQDSPVIFFYPLFFCFVSVMIHFVFIQQAEKVDSLSLHYMQVFAHKRFWHSVLLISGVLISLQLPEHYRVFPSIMALLLLQFALLSILQIRVRDLK